MRYVFIGAMALAALSVLSNGSVVAAEAGDAAAGKTVFSKCMACHSPEKGTNKIGPSLFGVVGRQSHSEAGFTYSPAMQAYNVTWDAETLDKYLTDPKGVVPGTKMVFPGLKSDKDRANVIAYLTTLK